MAVIRFPPNQSFTMKPHVLAFADAMEDHFGGGMNWGTYNGHSPPEGPTQALDHFNPNAPSGWAQQDRASKFAIENAEEFGLRYVISRLWIWNVERRDEGWRKRNATGDESADHLNHNHYTFYGVAGGTVPKPIERDAMSLVGRYTNGGIDWLFDGPARIWAAIGSAGVLRACDKSKVAEWGAMADVDHGWFRDVASMWDRGEEA